MTTDRPQQDVLVKVAHAIDKFMEGGSTIEDIQQSIALAIPLLDRVYQNLIDDLKDCETDLEFVLFAVPNDQQMREATVRLLRTQMEIRSVTEP